MHSDSFAGDANPYAPTPSGAAEPTSKRIRIIPVLYPLQAFDCSYFTPEQFAAQFTDMLVEACNSLGLDGRVDTGPVDPADDATIRCRVHHVAEYRITLSQLIRKWVPTPFGLNYHYRPGSFSIGGLIELRGRSAVLIDLEPTFEGRELLGKKSQMVVQMRSQAIQIASMAAKSLEATDLATVRRPFWAYVLLAPVVTATLAATAVYWNWEPIRSLLGKIAGAQQAGASGSQVEATFHAVLTFGAVTSALLAFAPGWVYADRRAAFAYRFASTSRSWVLRIWFLVCGLPFAVLLILSLLEKSIMRW